LRSLVVAYMLPLMADTATLVHEARERAGLSRKALAKRAGVPVSTVSRIEEAEVDPTTTMLRRLLAAAGRTLDFATGAVPQDSVAALTDAWSASPGGTKINWTRLRAFLDALHAHPDRLGAAIATPPPRSGNDQLDNLLAALAEKLADDASMMRPRWCAAVHPLPVPWEPPGTPRMKASARRSAPKQFKDRNIWLAEHDLWRNRD
jgi:transcriptional regulator with XRE-family HTH domain